MHSGGEGEGVVMGVDRALLERTGLAWPRELLFIGSGRSRTPGEWLQYPSIRTNARTLGKFPGNDIFAIMTWPAEIHDGLGGVLRSQRFKSAEPKPFLLLFDLDLHSSGSHAFISENAPGFRIGTKDRYEWPSFRDYVEISNRMGYAPRNSTGFFMVLWLLYADVDDIYVTGYDGHLALTGGEPGRWDTATPYRNLDGTEWVPGDNERIQKIGQAGRPEDFWYHNLTTEWRAIERAIGEAERRGVRVHVSKEAGYGRPEAER